jgi:hypothetical protein
LPEEAAAFVRKDTADSTATPRVESVGERFLTAEEVDAIETRIAFSVPLPPQGELFSCDSADEVMSIVAAVRTELARRGRTLLGRKQRFVLLAVRLRGRFDLELAKELLLDAVTECVSPLDGS